MGAMRKKPKDVRTLCSSCRAEYEEAGYRLKKVWVKYKEECDRCRYWLGWKYEITESENHHLRSSAGKSTEKSRFRRSEFDSRRR